MPDPTKLNPLLLTLALLAVLPTAVDAADDARLNAVYFVDAQHGWAVGDRGAIWHTDDGGTQWQRQSSGATCPLWDVRFLNEQHGWAAGGFTRPYTHASSGVILTTRDGGRSWKPIPRLVLPTLRRIGFFDHLHGWALGCRSAMYPSGVFLTDDGGESWRPLPSEGGSGWTAADMLDARTGALAGQFGSMAIVRAGAVAAARTDGADLRGWNQLRLVAPSGGWAVGEGGWVQMSTNLGATWQAPRSDLPLAARYFDFAALAARGPQCWIVGSPGTRVFHTPDAGRTWNAFDTGSIVPLRSIAFADDQHGWAAGELGTILATEDGGRTWRRQRSGGSRAAMLGVFGEPDDVPLELFARFAGSEGYFCAVETLGRRDIELPARDDVPANDRLHEAVVGVGGCATATTWQFPLRQPGLQLEAKQIVNAWDRAHDGRGLEELIGRVVRQIRIWRPEVIVARDAGVSEDAAFSSLVRQAVEEAVRRAADPNAFPGQIVEAGLKPWSVKRVYAVLPSGTRGGAGELITAQFSPALGSSLADATVEPHGLLEDRYVPCPPTVAFRLISGSVGEGDRRDLFGGLAIPPGSDARRPTPAASLDGLDALQRTAKKRRHIQAILEQAGRAARSSEQLLAQIDQLTSDLDRASAGQILFQLGDQCYRKGRWQAAAETFEALTSRYPEHPLTPSALVWLLQFYAGGEAACRLHYDPAVQLKRFERAVAIGQDLERTRFELFAEPAVRFPLAAAYRGLGQAKQAERFFQLQNRDDRRDAWWATAQGEMRLTDGKGHPPKSILRCVAAKERPKLDGRLDDPIWRKAKSVALRSVQHDDDDWPATVMLAHDAEFLYLAIRCKAAHGKSPDKETPASPRPRDGDLSAHDRVELFLNPGRNYATYYRLAVDDRGWTNDSCWGDATWNPTWFVAAGHDDGAWTIEAAIPLAELVSHSPQSGDTWAVGIQRIVPRLGFQSSTTPAAVRPLPDGFGYLLME